MSNSPFLQIHNKFELKLFDQKGQLLQEGFAYNVANSKRYVYEHIRGQAFISGFWNVEFGVGDVQNNPPTDHDYTLRNRIFSYNLPLFSRITPFSEDYQTIEFQSNEMSFPANRDYVGKLTEIGLADHYHNLYSHAAFVDVENHPIIIDKTENNIFYILASTSNRLIHTNAKETSIFTKTSNIKGWHFFLKFHCITGNTKKDLPISGRSSVALFIHIYLFILRLYARASSFVIFPNNFQYTNAYHVKLKSSSSLYLKTGSSDFALLILALFCSLVQGRKCSFKLME